MSQENRHRNPRMLIVQKVELIHLVQNAYIRIVGRYTGVNNVFIDDATWAEIARKVNIWGPGKTAEEWKSAFNQMKQRVKAKIKNMTKPLDFSELLEIDAKLARMFDMDKDDHDDVQTSSCETGDPNRRITTSGTTGSRSRGRGLRTRGGRGRIRGGTVRTQTNCDSTSTPYARMTPQQKEMLLNMVEKNFLCTVGRYSGDNGVAIKRRIWQVYAKKLNTLGPPKSPTGWNTAFTNIRLATKHKMALLRKGRNLTGGGENLIEELSELDAKVLSMCGLENLDGQQNLGEGGFPYKKTLQFGNVSATSTAFCVKSDANSVDANDRDPPVQLSSQSNDSSVNVSVPHTRIEELQPADDVNLLREEGLMEQSDDYMDSDDRAQLQETINGSNDQINDVVNNGVDQRQRSESLTDLVRQCGNNSAASSLVFQDERTVYNHRLNILLGIADPVQAPTATSISSVNVPQLSANITEAVVNSVDANDREPQVQLSSQSNDSSVNISVPQLQSANDVSLLREQELGRNASQSVNAGRPNQHVREGGTRRVVARSRHHNRHRNLRRDSESADEESTRHRNGNTSYEMVVRSINAQERFVEQSNENHSEMVHLFTSALTELSSVLRDFLNQNNN